MAISKILCIYMKAENTIQKENKKQVFSILKNNFAARFLQRDSLKGSITGYDLVISLGGDGTFLKSARHIMDKTPLLGINLDVKRKEGFYTKLNSRTLTKHVEKIKDGNFDLVPLMRLKARINGREIPLSLNEYYIGSLISFYSAKYELSIGRRREIQKSSGIIVATPSGSYAWYSSMGGKPLKFDDQKFVYMTREPYKGRVITCNMCHGELRKNQKLRIKYLLKYPGIIAVDSHKYFQLKAEDVVEITSSKNNLNWVIFR